MITEWQILDIAMQTYNKVSVSLDATLGKDSVGKTLHSSLLNEPEKD